MLDQTLIQTLGIIILAATVVVVVARRLWVPSIVSCLIVGLLLGPVFGLLPLEQTETSNAAADLDLIAEIGIVLLLFLVGLELSLKEIREVGKVAVFAGIGQVVFTALGGMGISLALGFSVIESVFLATALTFSSTVVVVKVLDQKGELQSLYGRIAVGIFLVQDIVVILVLTVLAGMGTAGEETSAGSIAIGIGKAFVGVAILAGLALLAARFVLPKVFGWMSRSPRGMVVWSLSWCFALVTVAHELGLSVEIGSFLAGLSLAQLKSAGDLRRRLHPLMNFFVAVFFVTLGSQMRFADAADQIGPALVLTMFVLIGNPLIFMLIITRFGYSTRTSFYTSVTVAQISEFSLIFAAAGFAMGLIDQTILSLVAIVGVLTIVASVYMIVYNRALFRLLCALRIIRDKPGAKPDEQAGHGNEIAGHIVVVGMNGLGRSLVEALHARGETVLAIDNDPRKLAGLPGVGVIGDVDYLSTLKESGLERAKLAICSLRIEDTNALLVYRCKQMGVPVATHAFDRSIRPAMERLEPDFIIDSKQAGDRRMEEVLASVGIICR